MAGDPELIAKWQKVLATRKEPEIQARAQEVLKQLGAEPSAPAETPAQEASQPEGPGLLTRLKNETVRELKEVPDAARGFAQGFNDHSFFGLPSKVLDMASHVPYVGQYIGVPEERQQAQRDAAGAVSRTLGAGAGLATSGVVGPEAAVGRSAQGLLGMAEQRLPALANTAVGRVVGQAGAGMLTGAGASAGQTATDGGDWRDVARSIVEGGKGGAVVGGGLGALGEAADAGANAIMSSAGGRARQLIEKYGGKVGPLTSGSGGALDQELAGLPANDRGIGQASRASSARILKGTEDTHFADTVIPQAERKAAIAASAAGDSMVDATPLYSELVKISRSQRLTPPEDSLVNSVLNRMDKLIEGRGSVQMTETELNDFKGMLQDLSGTGSMNAPTVAKAKLQGAAHSAKELVDEGPYAKTNAQAAEGIAKFERQRSLLGMKPRPSGGRESPEGPSEEEIAQLANLMSREEQNTVTAGLRNGDRLQTFAAENPQYQRDIDLPRVLEAKAELGLHTGAHGHGGLINRLPMPLGMGASAVMAAGGHGAASLIPLAGEFAARNAPAIAGRLLYTPAQELQMLLARTPTFEQPQGLQRLMSPGRPLPGFIPQIEQEYQDAVARLRGQQQENRQ